VHTMTSKRLYNLYVSPEGHLTAKAIAVIRRARFGPLKGEPPITERDFKKAEELGRFLDTIDVYRIDDEGEK
jgi:hypothetical protein